MDIAKLTDWPGNQRFYHYLWTVKVNRSMVPRVQVVKFEPGKPTYMASASFKCETHRGAPNKSHLEGMVYGTLEKSC